MTKQLKNTKPSWSELGVGKKATIMLTGSLQAFLAIAAWRNLAKQPAKQVNGRKSIWAAVIAINWVGPIAYFIWGHKLPRR